MLESLGKIGNASTLTPLISGLADPLRIVREVSIVALAAVYRKSTAEDRERIVAAVRSGIGDGVLPLHDEQIDTSGGDLQKAAVAVLGWAGRPSTVPKLLSLLRSEDMEEPVVQALRNAGTGAVPQLLDRLRDDNVLVRRTAAMVLGELGRLPKGEALQVVFVGQPEFEDKLNSQGLRQLHQRIGIKRQIRVFSERESEDYIDHRLRLVTSSSSERFTPKAISLICSQAQGIPRLIYIFLVIGTSGVVYPAAGFASVAKEAGAFVGEINLDPTPQSALIDVSLQGRAKDLVPLLLDPI